jgi:hypothetical protein
MMSLKKYFIIHNSMFDIHYSRLSATSFVLLLLCFPNSLFSQDTVRTREGMPRLEIPEVTIVGKKAITLPFARKGEVLDVELYDPPLPDTSVFAKRPGTVASPGSYPRFRETMFPLQAFIEGMVGNFGTFDVNGTLRYSELLWELSARGGLAATQGHTTNAEARQFTIGAEARATVETDNEIIRTFRTKGDANITGDTYKLFGIPDTVTERQRSSFALQTTLSTIDLARFNLDFELGVKTMSIEDRGRRTANVSVVEPTFAITGGYGFNAVNLFTQFQYSASLLDYPIPVESPTYVALTPGVRWNLSSTLSGVAALRYAHGAHSNGGSSTLLSPGGHLRWNALSHVWASLWFEPSLNAASPFRSIQENPYLIDTMVLRNERVPVNVGMSLALSTSLIEIEAAASVLRTDDTPLPIADSIRTGVIHLEYAKTQQVVMEIRSALNVTDRARVSASGSVHYAQEEGTSVQLAMMPEVKLQARGELSFSTPLVIWSSVEYTGPRNVDRQGQKKLDAYMLLNAGVSSNIIRSALFSLELENLLGTSYEWWSGYKAPGRRVALRAQWQL